MCRRVEICWRHTELFSRNERVLVDNSKQKHGELARRLNGGGEWRVTTRVVWWVLQEGPHVLTQPTRALIRTGMQKVIIFLDSYFQ